MRFSQFVEHFKFLQKMNIPYVLPETGYPMTDFQTKVIEIVLNLHSELGSFEKANDVLFRMFEIAFPHSTDEEKLQFTKVQGAFRCINTLIASETETFNDLILERESYVLQE